MTNDFKISSTGLSERSDIIDPPILPLLFLFHSIREITNKTLNSKPGTKNLFKQNTKLRGFIIVVLSRVSFCWLSFWFGISWDEFQLRKVEK